MKIAALVEQGRLATAAACTGVKIYTIEKGALTGRETLAAAGEEALALAWEKGAAVLLSAGLTPEERQAAGRAGTALFTAAGSPDEALLDLLERQLVCDPDACPAGGACATCEGCG